MTTAPPRTITMASSATEAESAAVADALNARGLRVILGSKSFTRKAILTEMGIEYEVVTADIDEKAIRMDVPSELVMALANAKADAIVSRLRGEGDASADRTTRTLLITSDQVVVHDGVIREKPESEEEARNFIASYGVSPATTVGAIAVTDLETGARFSAGDSSTVHFAAVPAASIDFMIEEGECFHCAGALMVEHQKMNPLVTRMDGSMDSVMGLSKAVVGRLIMEAIGARDDKAD